MAHQQIAVNLSGTSVQYAPRDNNVARHYLYIQNYAGSAGTMYVAIDPISGVATPGNNGEIEILPGRDFVWGGNYGEGALPTVAGNNVSAYSANCPQGSVNIINSGGTAKGCIEVISFPGA